MSYLDEIYNDEIYTGPHSLESYFSEEYATAPMYESTALSDINNKPVLKNIDFNHYDNQYVPNQPPKGFIKYQTIDLQNSKTTIEDNEPTPKSRMASKTKELFVGTSCLRMIDIFILVLICILMVIQIKINWNLGLLTNPHLQYRQYMTGPPAPPAPHLDLYKQNPAHVV